MTKFQIGAQLYSVRDLCTNYDDMLAALKALKAMGYNTCQIAGHSGDITPVQIKEMLDITGMTMGSTHYSFFDMEKDLDAVAEIHKMWGCYYPGIGYGPFNTPEDFKNFTLRANVVADKFAKHGMHLVYHNHSNELHRFPGLGKSGIEIMLENASPNFQFELDLYWVQYAGGDPIDYLRRFAGRVDVVHFKEMNATLANDPIMVPMGCGNMNWKAIMDVCDEVGVKFAFVEQDNAVDNNSL